MSDNSKNLLIILVGPPGSGKGTQAELLAEKLGFYHLGSSEIIKEKLPSLPTEQERRVRQDMNSGKLIPADLMAQWAVEKIDKLIFLGMRGYVLDGCLRTMREAEILDKYFSQNKSLEVIIIFVNIPPEESLKRRLYRRVCANCRRAVPYNEETKKIVVCPECGGPLQTRKDDTNEEALVKRWHVYQELTFPVIQHYRQKKMIKEINGLGTIEEVHQRIMEALNSSL